MRFDTIHERGGQSDGPWHRPRYAQRRATTNLVPTYTVQQTKI